MVYTIYSDLGDGLWLLEPHYSWYSHLWTQRGPDLMKKEQKIHEKITFLINPRTEKICNPRVNPKKVRAFPNKKPVSTHSNINFSAFFLRIFGDIPKLSAKFITKTSQPEVPHFSGRSSHPHWPRRLRRRETHGAKSSPSATKRSSSGAGATAVPWRF